MPAVVSFRTIPEMYTRLVEHYDGQEVPVLRYRDQKSGNWIEITWEELNRYVQSLAGYLHTKGIRHGDRVAILSENRPEWVIIDMAVQILGGVNVALYTSLPEAQVQYILDDSGAEIVFTSSMVQQRKVQSVYDDCSALGEVISIPSLDSEGMEYIRSWDEVLAEGEEHWYSHRDKLSPIRDEVEPDDLASLIYTSGTTGQPKGVMLTHDNFCSNIKAALSRVPFDHTDHHLSFLPLCHSFERTAGYLAVLACGAKISYAESVNSVARDMQEVEPTVMIAVPRLFERMHGRVVKTMEEGSPTKQKIFDWAVRVGQAVARKQLNGEQPGLLLQLQQRLAHQLVFSKLHEKLGGNLRFAVSGGAALPKDIGEFFMAAGVKIIEGYGLTETSPVISANPFKQPRFGSVGHILPDVTVGIQRLEDGSLLARLNGNDYPSNLDSEEGEIVVKGPNVMKGYWNDPDATEEAIDANGWYHTGDVGQFEDGHLKITDRVKHMIVSKGGKNIYPGPIEDQFKTVRWIDQIMVVGEGREFLCALVVPDFDELQEYARKEELLYGDLRDLLDHPEIQKLFKQEFQEYSRTAPGHEKIRRFRLLDQPFTVENRMQTPTLKLRREQIKDQFGDTIDEMYDEVMSRHRS